MIELVLRVQGCEDVGRLCFAVAPLAEPWAVAAIIRHYSARLRELDLSLRCGWAGSPPEPEILHALGTLQRLRLLRLHGCISVSATELSGALQDCPELQVLDVEGLHEPWGPQFVAHVTQAMGRGLRELVLPKRHSVMDDAVLAQVLSMLKEAAGRGRLMLMCFLKGAYRENAVHVQTGSDAALRPLDYTPDFRDSQCNVAQVVAACPTLVSLAADYDAVLRLEGLPGLSSLRLWYTYCEPGAELWAALNRPTVCAVLQRLRHLGLELDDCADFARGVLATCSSLKSLSLTSDRLGRQLPHLLPAAPASLVHLQLTCPPLRPGLEVPRDPALTSLLARLPNDVVFVVNGAVQDVAQWIAGT